MEIQIKTITPVHIGSGVELQPYEYSFDNLEYTRYNMAKIFEKIYEVDPSLIDKIDKWIAEFEVKQDKTDSGTKSNSRLNFTFENFLKLNQVDAKTVRRIMSAKDCIKYSFALPYSVSKRKILKEMIKTHDNKALIPGSSIKGAIRSALAFYTLKSFANELVRSLLNGEPGSDIKGLKKVLSSINNDGKSNIENIKKSIGNEIEKIIFYAGFRSKENRIIFSDEKFDLMKAVKVSDTYSPGAEITVLDIGSYTKAKERGAAPRSYAVQPLSIFEIIEANSKFKFKIDVDIDYLFNLYSKKSEIIGIKEKIQRLFGFDISAVNKINIEEYKTIALNFIISSIKDFSKEIIEKDLKWLSKFNPSNVAIIKKSMDEVKKNLDENRIVLRLGYSSGFHSTTVALAMVKNPELKKFFEEMINKFNIGVPPKMLRDRVQLTSPINPDALPTSRRMAELNDRDMKTITPLGWIMLELK